MSLSDLFLYNVYVSSHPVPSARNLDGEECGIICATQLLTPSVSVNSTTHVTSCFRLEKEEEEEEEEEEPQAVYPMSKTWASHIHDPVLEG